MGLSIYRTEDGSDTVYNPDFDEHYHNRHGAISESEHVFFEALGIQQALTRQRPIRLFETGFGTGLNLLLLLRYCKQYNFRGSIFYHTVEAFPLDAKLFNRLNMEESFTYTPWVARIFENLQSGFNSFYFADGFELNLTIYRGYMDSLDYPSTTPLFDFIWHDAFAPETNTELWNHRVFGKLYRLSSDRCLLSTYAASSSARAGMCAAGWYVARRPGALGKREMTLVAKHPRLLEGHKLVNKERLAQRYRNMEFITHPAHRSPSTSG